MAAMFADHPRKKVVREDWDTPVLNFLHDRWNHGYFYFGLPGPQALDIRLWREMIRRVVAFEIEEAHSRDPRRSIVELNRQLALLGVPYSVYCGPLEEVVLGGVDYDGRQLEIKEFVTLFNLDFCNSITGAVRTAHGKRYLRFEALREIVSFQRRLYRAAGVSRFVMLVTVQDAFHVRQLRSFVSNPDLPSETADYLSEVLRDRGLPDKAFACDTALLKAFVFTCLREYLRGQNATSVFLPPVVYYGAAGHTQMMHFVVVCAMEREDTALVEDPQGAADFLGMQVLRADERDIKPEAACGPVRAVVTDSVSVVRNYLFDE